MWSKGALLYYYFKIIGAIPCYEEQTTWAEPKSAKSCPHRLYDTDFHRENILNERLPEMSASCRIVSIEE